MVNTENGETQICDILHKTFEFYVIVKAIFFRDTRESVCSHTHTHAQTYTRIHIHIHTHIVTLEKIFDLTRGIFSLVINDVIGDILDLSIYWIV